VREHLTPWRRPRAAGAVILSLVLLALAAPAARAQDAAKYHTYAELTSLLQAAVAANPTLARLDSIGRTVGGRDIWVVELANSKGVPVKERPALLIAASFEGDHLVGSEIALAVVEYFLKNYAGNADVKARLDNSVIYVVPRVNPDGTEGMFGPVKAGRRTNLNPRDEDNDGRLDEDGPEDLNKDGLITLMRVKAADGEYMIDPEEPRLMKRADPKKGERGEYKLYWEGVDNDKDGFINEDPVGGTDLNRNFMHEYPYYKPDSGLHMMSERESRALMEWVIAHRNVAAILTLGESDNLVVPPTTAGRLGPARDLDLVRFADAANTAARTVGVIETGGGFGRFRRGEFSFEMMGEFMRAGRSQAAAPTTTESGRPRMPERRPATTVNTADYDYFKAVSDKYIELTGIRQPLFVREPQGAFFQYGYFQFGVPSFSTPGFGLAQAESPFPRRTGGPGAAPGQGGQTGGQTGGQQMIQTMQAGGQSGRAEFMRMFQTGGPAGGGETAAAAPGIDRQVLRWMDSEKVDGFVKWTPVAHPDLGDVEVGGFKPYAVTNPPAAKLAELGAAHVKFVLHLTSLFAKVQIAKAEVQNLGGGLFRVEAEIENAGFWPTALAHAVTSRSVKPTLVQIGIKPEDVVAGNNKTNFVQTLPGSGNRAKYEWLIKGKTGDVIEIHAVSQKGGAATARVTLK